MIAGLCGKPADFSRRSRSWRTTFVRRTILLRDVIDLEANIRTPMAMKEETTPVAAVGGDRNKAAESTSVKSMPMESDLE